MATYLENLITRRDAVAQQLADMDSDAAGGKPNATKGTVNHVEYRLSLLEELDKLEARIEKARASGDGTPWEIVSRGY